MSDLVQNIISGIVGGTVVLVIQFVISWKIENKKKEDIKKVGRKSDKHIDEDFILNYLPQNIEINKIIDDFGQPQKKYPEFTTLKWDNNRECELSIYQYEFVNAVVLFSTFKNGSTVISITINSSYNKSFPINIGFGFGDKKGYLGLSKVNEEIINNKIEFLSESYTNWAYSAVKSKFFYREIKGLTFTYVVCNIIENEDEILGQVIDQLCISANEDVCPIIYFYDMI